MHCAFLSITNKEGDLFYLVLLLSHSYGLPPGTGCFPCLPSALLAHVPLLGPHHQVQFISLCIAITETYLPEAEFSHIDISISIDFYRISGFLAG